MKKIGKVRLRRTFRVAQLRKRDVDLDWRSWWSQRPSWNCPKRWLSIHVHFADLALLSSLPTSGLAGKPKSFISRRAKRHLLEQLWDKCTLHSWKEMDQLGTLFEILRESRLPGTRLSKQPQEEVRDKEWKRDDLRELLGDFFQLQVEAGVPRYVQRSWKRSTVHPFLEILRQKNWTWQSLQHDWTRQEHASKDSKRYPTTWQGEIHS